jgi:hypothetical protein
MRSGNACNISNVNETELWLYRYGHSQVKSMSFLQRKSMVKGLPLSFNQIPSCESCIVGKHQGPSSYRAKECIELVHT